MLGPVPQLGNLPGKDVWIPDVLGVQVGPIEWNREELSVTSEESSVCTVLIY